MQCFSTIHADITIAPNTPAAKWELTLLPLDQIAKLTTLPPAPLPALHLLQRPAANKAPAPALPMTNLPRYRSRRTTQARVVGRLPGQRQRQQRGHLTLLHSTRPLATAGPTARSLYNGGLAAILDNSALDARPYSLSGLESPKPSYN